MFCIAINYTFCLFEIIFLIYFISTMKEKGWQTFSIMCKLKTSEYLTNIKISVKI